MKDQNKIAISLSIVGFFVILGWKNIYSGQCLNLVFPFVFFSIIGFGVMELSVKKRECLARSYFVEGSFPYRFFNSKKLVFIKSILLSIILSTSLALASISWDLKIFYLLFMDIFIIFWINSKIIAILTGSIKESLKFVISKDISVAFNSFFLLALLLIIQLYTPIPAYVDTSLKVTLNSAFTVFSSECAITNFLLIINTQKDALGWWVMLNIDSHIHDQSLKFIAWLAFLVTNGLATYAFSRYTIQLLDLLRFVGKKNEQYRTTIKQNILGDYRHFVNNFFKCS